jgi:phage terminase large subunit-like protein
MDASFAQRLSGLSEKEFLRVLRRFPDDELNGLMRNWDFWSRDAQREPEGDWRVWLVMAGRGFGKTRAGAEWVRSVAENDGEARIALVAATLHEARSVMVEGPSGLLAIAPEKERPIYAPSLRRLVWRSGAQAALYGAAEPESLRGPEHSHGWADEIAKWPGGEDAWDNLMMGMRLGARPRIMATTTPRPVALLRRLVRESDVMVTRGRTVDNEMNLPGSFLSAMQQGYGGTRLGRQELDGELIEEIEGALWTRDLIERRRVRAAPAVKRMVIGVDPPASAHGDACGIVAVALGADGRAYVVADASVSGRSPEGWARAVAEAAAAHGADRVVAEANNGGAMVESVLRAADFGLPVRLVHASRGKVARAEPVALLYEGGKALHVGAFPELEDEMCGLLVAGGYEGPGRSPDRADAMVWAMTELMLGSVRGEARVRVL